MPAFPVPPVSFLPGVNYIGGRAYLIVAGQALIT